MPGRPPNYLFLGGKGMFLCFYAKTIVPVDTLKVGIRSLLFLKKVVNFGRIFSNFDKVLIINLGLACLGVRCQPLPAHAQRQRSMFLIMGGGSMFVRRML
jgi:hypothetical protein